MEGHFTLANSLKLLPTPDGKRFVEIFQHGTLTVELYAPRGIDAQTPHARDEVYVIASGTGIFRHEHVAEQKVGPGDVLFVAAGVEHRFANFSDDFATWVFFYGPEGGEKVR